MVDAFDSAKKALSHYSSRDITTYVIGSMELGFYDQNVSDIDVLIVDYGDFLSDRAGHIATARNVYAALKDKYEVVDIFFIGKKTLPYYLTYLPVISDRHTLSHKAVISGEPKDLVSDIPFSLSTRHNVYIAEAARRITSLKSELLVANTHYARKHAKYLLRTLKILLCASSNEQTLVELEKQLFSVRSFSHITKVFKSEVGISIQFDEVFDAVLQGEEVKDWPAWMIAQQALLDQIVSLPVYAKGEMLDNIFEKFAYIAREMLVRRVKEVVSQETNEDMLRLSALFVDDTASIMASLALMNVDGLVDLDSSETPDAVRSAYSSIVRYLQNGQIGVGVFVESLVLLEYALDKACLDMCRKV